MLTSVQYTGESHTFIRLSEGAEKTKVGYGEIIDVPEEEVTRFRSAGFQVVESKKEISTTAPKAKAKK